MGDESKYSDWKTASAQAPPFSVTGQDFDAAKAAQDAQVAARQAPPAIAPSRFDSGSPSVPTDVRQNPTNTGSGSFGDKLASALSSAKAGANAEMLQQPAAWSKLMIGATMDALAQPTRPGAEAAPTGGPGSSDFQADRTTPTDAPQQMPDRTRGQKFNDALSDLGAAQGPGGFLGGLTRTATAQNEREREQMKDKLHMAVANAQMVHEQALTHKLGDDAMAENITTGKQAIESMIAPPPSGGTAGTRDAQGKTSDELNKMIQDGVFHPSTQTAYPDGRVMEGKDSNGLPIWRTTYSVVTPPASMSLGEENAKLVNEQLGMKLDPKQVLPGIQVNTLLQQANTAKTNSDARELAAKKLGIEKQEVDDQVGLKEVDKNPQITKVLDAVSVPGKNGEIDAYAPIKAYNYMKTNGGFEKFGVTEGAARLWAGNGSAKGFETMNENFAKEQQKSDTKANDIISKVLENPSFLENDYNAAIAAAQMKVNSKDPSITPKDRKDAADVLALATQVKADKAAEKAEGKKKENPYKGDDSLSGPDFLASLPAESQGTVKAIGEGRAGLLNLGYLIARKPEVFDAVTKAYPDFDGSNIASYINTNKEFKSTKSNTAGGALNAGGTAMGHLAELRELNTNASHIAHSSAWTAYKNKVDTVAAELAKFYGDTTVPAIASIKDTLMSTLPGNREAAITTQAQSMGDKLESYEQTWKNAAPSPAYESPLPQISDSQKRAFASLNPKYADEHPEYAPKTTKNASDKPMAPKQYKVGGTFTQNGHLYVIDKLDAEGHIVGAH